MTPYKGRKKRVYFIGVMKSVSLETFAKYTDTDCCCCWYKAKILVLRFGDYTALYGAFGSLFRNFTLDDQGKFFFT